MEKKYIHFGKRLRQLRLEKGLSQEALAEKLGMKNNSYISDVENGRFIPKGEKMENWAKALDLSEDNVSELKLEAEIERLGIADPAFTMMFKEVPDMTQEEKQSIIRAYEAVKRAREARTKRA